MNGGRGSKSDIERKSPQWKSRWKNLNLTYQVEEDLKYLRISYWNIKNNL